MSPEADAQYADPARRYRLDERIATGGMGRVFRGTDTTLGRTVAIKVLREEYGDDAGFRSRFASEARHAGALHHPGIAAVFDAGSEPRPYLVMEYVDGRPLSDLLRPGVHVDPDAARHLLAQVADALAAAHAAGIVHRDIKPHNLLVTPDQQIKVTDFGIARAAEGAALTATGQVMGTPQYLSPEQARGEQATAASDVYSLGVVAFEALAGRRPFTGDTPVTTALAHLREPVPELPDDVPADLAGVVRTALAKDPADRFASAAAFAAALRDPGSARPAPTGPAAAAGPTAAAATSVLPVADDAPDVRSSPPPEEEIQGRRWLPWVLLGLLLVVAIAVFAFTAGGDGEDPAPPEESTSESAEESQEPSPTEPTDGGSTDEGSTQPAETQPTETQPTENQPTETPTETQPTEPTETQPTESPSTPPTDSPTDSQPTDTQEGAT